MRAAILLPLLLAGVTFAQAPAVKAPAGAELKALRATPQEVSEGKRLAQDTCAKCHGANGVSAGAGVPHLAGQRAPYLYAQLRTYKDGKGPHSAMNDAVTFLADDALMKVAAYYASLDPAPRAATKAAPPKPDAAQAGKAAAGACAGCHGEGGVSAMAGTPSLAGLDPKYLAAATSGYKTGARKNDLMKGFASGLSDADMQNVALYYALQKPAKSPAKAAGDAAAGKAAATACAGCHGENGVSATAATPSLAGQDPEYLVAATKAYKEGSRNDETMKGIAAGVDEKALRDVAAFFASQTPQAPNVKKPLSIAEWVDRCDRCHGVNGNSTDPLVPAVAAQRADWLEQVLGAYKSGARKSTAMSAMTSGLADADIKEIAAHYSRQNARPVTYIVVPAQ